MLRIDRRYFSPHSLKLGVVGVIISSLLTTLGMKELEHHLNTDNSPCSQMYYKHTAEADSYCAKSKQTEILQKSGWKSRMLLNWKTHLPELVSLCILSCAGTFFDCQMDLVESTTEFPWVFSKTKSPLLNPSIHPILNCLYITKHHKAKLLVIVQSCPSWFLLVLLHKLLQPLLTAHAWGD